MARTRGQIETRGESTWRVRVFVGHDGSGRRRYKSETVHGSRRDADKVLTRLLREKDIGSLVAPSRITLNQYLDDWLAKAVAPRVRAATLEEYMATLRRYVRGSLGKKRLEKITPTDIQGVYADMQVRGIGKSVRYTHTLLRGALDQAVKWQLLARNPADYVDVPKRKVTNTMRAMSREEVERFLKAAGRSKWSSLFHLLVGTGLRPSEALALTWRDIDPANGHLTVRGSVRWVNKGWVFSAPKTASSRRTIPIPQGLVSILLSHLERQKERGLPELVFCGIDGNPVHQEGIVKDAFKPALERAGLPKSIRFYDLRHTHATLLLLAQVHPKVVAERLGHSSIRITLDTYSHVLPTMQEQAALELESLLYGDARSETVDRILSN